MKKALPVLFIQLLFSLSISLSFFFPLIGEAVIGGPSILRSSETGSNIVLAQAQPAETAQQGTAEGEPVGAETPAPGGVKPEEIRQPGIETEQPQPAPVPPVAPRKGPVPRQPSQAAGGPVSFFFDDADVFEVIQTVFGDVLKVNYIIDPKVKGKVTFRTVTPIPKDEVLGVMEIILRINGVGFVEEKGLYRIVALTDVPTELVYAQVGKDPDKVAIELFTFKNMNLKESMTDIQNAIGLNVQGGTMRILPVLRLNALMVVTSTKEQMEYVRKWIEAFDTMFAYARPKITVYPLQNSKADHVASMLSSILGGGGAAPAPAAPRPAATPAAGAAAPAAAPKAGPAATVTGGSGFLVSPETKIFADEITNSLIILSTPADYAFIEETIKKLDVLPRQVVIEGLLVRVDLTDNLSFGFSWNLNTDVNIKGLKPFRNDQVNLDGLISSKPAGSDFDSTVGDGFTFVGTDPKGVVRAKVVAALKDSKAKILAAPHILVSDNREARIQVGRQVPLATSTTTTPSTTTTTTGLTSTSTIQYKDTGIILKVKPQINDSGLVSLEIAQENSDLGEIVKIAGQDFQSLSKTETTTTLVVQDGETIIIGGLIQETATKTVDGIPLLSKIPVLGSLFSTTTDNNLRTELIILLTPHVMKNMREAEKVTSEYVDRYKTDAKDKGIDRFIEERGKKEKGQKEKKSGDLGSEDGK